MGINVPADFRFSVKVPKIISHEKRLRNAQDALDQFIGEIAGLGDRLAVLLVQLPPSLAFDRTNALEFFKTLARSSDARLVCEPRHASWFEQPAVELMHEFDVARILADPSPVPGVHAPADPLASPIDDSTEALKSTGPATRKAYWGQSCQPHPGRDRRGDDSWNVFDKKASGFATVNALELGALMADDDH
jgi:hypothetical protein